MVSVCVVVAQIVNILMPLFVIIPECFSVILSDLLIQFISHIITKLGKAFANIES